MTRVAIAGIAGRMGTRIREIVTGADDLTLVGGWEAPDHEAVGTTVGEITVSGDPADVLSEADVYIDFTHPEPTLAHLRAAADAGTAAVIGTTGFDAAPAKLFRSAYETIPVVWAPNMSVGVNLLLRLVQEAAQSVPDYDAEVIELHHHHKKDAPSGTAKALTRELQQVRDVGDDALRHGRSGMVGARTKSEIGVHAVRAGDIVGDHTVLLAGAGERIELTHRAINRDPFAYGAVRAARWVTDRAPGLYGMPDVLGWTS